MTREEKPQRANCEMIAALIQSGADFGQDQIVFLSNQRMNTHCLRFDPVRQQIATNIGIPSDSFREEDALVNALLLPPLGDQFFF
ncbi:hypothetical protein JK191_01520 [Gluconobacter sphaericus]|uniref:hypothetical protein n=1 Tax=Gluconobacter sphaericus TaxID=574987 RepID=UPI001B8B5F40|nr:hypothetical protein [Gluconobacter sphaericus]MBS1096273.1 hypothetical protein [Gluconobacter sphaericus]